MKEEVAEDQIIYLPTMTSFLTTLTSVSCRWFHSFSVVFFDKWTQPQFIGELNILDQSRLLSEYVRQRVVDLTQGALRYDNHLIGLVEEIAGFLQYIGEMYDLINKIHNMPINQRSSQESRELFEAGYLALREKIYSVRNFGNGPIDRLNSLRTDTEVLSHQLRGFFRRFDLFLDGVVRHLQQEERVGVVELVCYFSDISVILSTILHCL